MIVAFLTCGARSVAHRTLALGLVSASLLACSSSPVDGGERGSAVPNEHAANERVATKPPRDGTSGARTDRRIQRQTAVVSDGGLLIAPDGGQLLSADGGLLLGPDGGPLFPLWSGMRPADPPITPGPVINMPPSFSQACWGILFNCPTSMPIALSCTSDTVKPTTCATETAKAEAT